MRTSLACTLPLVLALTTGCSARALGESSDGGVDLGSKIDLGSTRIPKTDVYRGAKLDPHLDSELDCADATLEPNDTFATAFMDLNAVLALEVDRPAPKLGMLAICPTGDNPEAGGHDRDFYELEVPPAAWVLIELDYDVRYGDLDVGLFRDDGRLLVSDGTAVSNGCVAAMVPPGRYYIGVVGANDVDSNRYNLRVRFFSTPRAC